MADDFESDDDFPNIVSVDDHIVEPPRLWLDRLPKKYHDRVPHVVREEVHGEGVAHVVTATEHGGAPNGADGRIADVWHYQDVHVPMMRVMASVGMPPSEVRAIGMTYDEMRPGCYDPTARLSDMDANGVDISLCFPNIFIRFCGQVFLEASDHDLALLCVQAYNDFLVDEWQKVGSGRLFGVGLIPLWDVDLAVAEVVKNANRGIRAVCFSEIPAWLGLPSLYEGYWEPFFNACAETGTVIQIHIGSSSRALITSDDAPRSVVTANLYLNSSLSLSDFILSGVFSRHSGLKVAYAESQAGWVPYLLDRLDILWEEGNLFHEARQRLPRRPSEYYADHVYTCVFNDRVAFDGLLHRIGSDNICFETDYPHPDGTWPNSKAVAKELLSGVDPAVAHKVLRTNGLKMLGISDQPEQSNHDIAAPSSFAQSHAGGVTRR